MPREATCWKEILRQPFVVQTPDPKRYVTTNSNSIVEEPDDRRLKDGSPEAISIDTSVPSDAEMRTDSATGGVLKS